MAQPEQGKFDAPLDVTRNRTIQGAVTAGATVRSGATLAIQGAAAGHFVVEPEAILTVQGALSGTFKNDGTVLVAGVVTDHLPNTGRVAVAAGTLLTGDRTLILRPGGSLEEVRDGEDIQVDASASCYLAYDPRDGQFHHLGD